MLNFFKNRTKGRHEDMWILAGLGNPGDQYSKNRHNIGFMVADAIAEEFDFPPFCSKYQALVSEGTIEGQKVLLLKPQTYMNNSGVSVKAAAKFYKIPTDHVIVFHDELDLAPGKVRVKKGGGNAGHNGLKSIQAHLGTADFIRVRLGIGHPGDKSRVHGYVLSDFSKSEKEWLEKLILSAGRHAGKLVLGDESAFMTAVASDRPS